MRPTQRKSGYDRITLLLLFTLSIVGVLMNFAVEYPDAGHLFQLPLETHFQKQSLFIILGGFIFLFVALFDRSIWHSLAYPIYFFGLLTLILVLVFGHTVKGSTSWFIIGGFTIQPSEFVKFGTILALSSFLSHYTTNLKRLFDRLVGMAIILVPTGLILLQPDAGSATVFSILFLVLLRAGISPIYYLLLIILLLTGVFSLQYPLPAVAFCLVMAAVFLLAFKKSERGSWLVAAAGVMILSGLVLYQTMSWWSIVPGFILFSVLFFSSGRQSQWQTPALTAFALVSLLVISISTRLVFQNVLKPHQKERINAWLSPENADPQGSLYNLLQSQMAIGSGGWSGKGYLNGAMTQLDYVPEQSTDFIFSTIGEEFGFLGSVFVIVLCFGIIFRVLFLAERMRTPFGMYFAYGVASTFFFHVMVNIGMTMGLLPVIGIPLPFVSYGGSSILAFSFMFAVVLHLHADDKR